MNDFLPFDKKIKDIFEKAANAAVFVLKCEGFTEEFTDEWKEKMHFVFMDIYNPQDAFTELQNQINSSTPVNDNK